MEQIYNLPYFNKVTLGTILGKSGQNLSYWIKTRLKNGEIVALKKGLFISKIYLLKMNANLATSGLYSEYLANIIRYPSYLSLEYVLSLYNLIPERVFTFTSITLKSSRSYYNNLGNFDYRNIKEVLFTGYITKDLNGTKIKIASKAKALFDWLYLKNFKTYSNMKQELTQGLRINWDEFGKDDIDEFKGYVEISKSAKMKKIIAIKW